MRLQTFNISFLSSKKELITAFLSKRFWLVLAIGILLAAAASIVIFSDEVMARINHANGFYTKVCGDNITPNGDINGNVFRPGDACQNRCDLGAGSCSGDSVFRFECDGRVTDCRSNQQGPSSSQSLNRSGLCGKTVQIDVFRRNCLASGDCNGLFSWDPNADLQDFIVWYSGDCAAASPSPAPVAPGAVTCNDSSVSLVVSPAVVNQNSQINFRINGDGSTFPTDEFGGGAINCQGEQLPWRVGSPGLTCAAPAPGNFTWTHTWRHCEGNFNNCSNTCVKTASFAVVATPPPPSPVIPPSVDIKANGSDGPITINFNTSATLSWTSANANSCTATNGWSGAKPTSGIESTGSMTFAKAFTITCQGPGGQASDSVTVNVQTALVGNLTAQKTAANLSDGTSLMEQVSADPNEIILFSIQVSGTVAQSQNVVVQDTLPSQIKFKDNLRVDNVLVSGDIVSGLNIGAVSPGQTKTITFEAQVLGPEKFNFGQTQLTNSVSAAAAGASAFDTAQVVVTKKAVAGATDVSTGLTNNLFLDSFFLPFLFASAGVWVFKSRIIRFEEWRDDRGKEYQKFHADKLLQLKIAKIKAREFLQKRIG